MRVMIVDDEQPCLDELEYLLAMHTDIEVTGKYTNPLQALSAVESSLPDAVFLDIVMPHMSGIELAEKIHAISPEIQAVFVTAHAGCLIETNMTRPFDCILKPVSKRHLNTVVERLRERKPEISYKVEGPSRP